MSISCSCCGRFSLLRSLIEKFAEITEDELAKILQSRPKPTTPAGLYPVGEYIFTNGTILTLSETASASVEALLIGDGLIKQLGNLQDIKQAAPNATVIDLDGSCLMPGLIDPHMHIIPGAFSGLLLDVSPTAQDCTNYTIDYVRDKLQAAVDTADPQHGWVFAAGFDASKLDQWVNLTNEWFSKLNNKNNIPIIVQAGSGHLTYANDIAMELAGITALTVDPPGGLIGRFEDTGQLSGVFIELPAQALLKKAFVTRPPSLFNGIKDVIALFEEIEKLFNLVSAQGITTLNDAGLGLTLPYLLEHTLVTLAWEWQEKPVRLASAMFINEWNPSDIPEAFANGPDLSDPMFYRQAIKLFADGSNQGVTGFQRVPYSNWALQRTQRDYLGLDIQGSSDLNVGGLASLIKQANDYNWQVMIHANGDGAIDHVIQAHRLAGSAQHQNLRHRIEHCSILHDEQIQSMVELGLTPTFLIEHLGNWGEVLGNILGNERVQLLDRCGSALAAGLKFSLHSDYPVSNFIPLMEIQDAVTRIVRSNQQVLNPAERVSIDEALKAKTIYAAWHCHLEKYVGSLEPGKFADLTVLAQDPHEVNPVEISNIPVLQTWVGGRQVYSSSSSSA